jgi:hypothetical protein
MRMPISRVRRGEQRRLDLRRHRLVVVGELEGDAPAGRVGGRHKVSTLGEGATPYVHFAYTQRPAVGESILARTRGDAGALLAAMRRELLALDPNLVFLERDRELLTEDLQIGVRLRGGRVRLQPAFS